MMFLANGVRLQGYIRSFDKYSVQLARGDSSQVVFKHAISAINPDGPIQLTNRDRRELRELGWTSTIRSRCWNVAEVIARIID